MLENVLSGYRVIDLTQNVAGPFCTQILGDMGAEVIKIERPGAGDDTRAWPPLFPSGDSATYAALNRNKKSVCIDLDQQAGQALVRQLLGTADVFVHSLKPGSAETRGLGEQTLRAAQPGLIYCAISAFGQVGPLRSLPGYDPVMQAFTGIMSVTGNEGDDPVRVGPSVIDLGTGMWAAMGTLAAFLQRSRTGQGACVTASLLETAMSWMSLLTAMYLASGQLPKKMGSAMTSMAPYELFKSADGMVFIAAGNDRLFANACAALECPELATDPRFATNAQRTTNRKALHEAIEQRTQLLPTQEIVARLRRHGAPCSEMHNIAQMIEHEQVQAMQMLKDLPLPKVPEHRAMALPLALDHQRSQQWAPPPALGAHTLEVLQGLGCSDAQIAALRAQGVIA